MPELPEVETTRRGVAPHVVGRRVASVAVYDPRLRWPVPPDLPQRLIGRTVDAVDRRSKYLLFRLASDTLLVHLGMTGSLRVFRRAPARRPHDHVDIVLDDGTVLRYNDPRRFGAMLWVPARRTRIRCWRAWGPSRSTPAFDADYLWHATRTRSAAIKLALMDNGLVVGVGNIYANESLFRAGIRPTLPRSGCRAPRLARLVDAVRSVLTEAIAKGGSTLRDYVDASGEPGYFQLDYFVYGREGEPCRVCGAPIRMRRLGGRASFYCPSAARAASVEGLTLNMQRNIPSSMVRFSPYSGGGSARRRTAARAASVGAAERSPGAGSPLAATQHGGQQSQAQVRA
jgi:formamidopyrimidine-DNA glycosylase